MPAVLNAANEVAVDAFLDGHCPLDGSRLPLTPSWTAGASTTQSIATRRAGLHTDAEARRMAHRVLGNTNAPSGVPNS